MAWFDKSKLMAAAVFTGQRLMDTRNLASNVSEIPSSSHAKHEERSMRLMPTAENVPASASKA